MNLMTILNAKVDEWRVTPRAIKRHVLRWALIFLFCTLYVLIYSATLYFNYLSGLVRSTRPLSWWQLFFQQLLFWYPVALLAPLSLWFGQRFRIERQNWLRVLPIHLLLSFAFNMLYVIASTFVMRLVSNEPLIPRPFIPYFTLQTVNRLPMSMMTYGAILGIGYAFEYYRKYREQELQTSQLEAKLAQAQLAALKMQLHPHFLFNTLHTISAFMGEDIKVARRMIVRLSELLRLTLENAGQQEVSLKQELEALERYLEIEQIRFQDRLVVQMAIEPETLDARVPNLLLQPLVENAIRHGIAPHSSAGRIEIHSRRQDHTLEIQVRDDGPGMPEVEEFHFRERIGLANTRARLKQLYGDAHRFEIENAAEGGLLVTVVIPFQLAVELSSIGKQ